MSSPAIKPRPVAEPETKMRDIVCLLELDQRTMGRRRKVDGQDCGLWAVAMSAPPSGAQAAPSR